MTMQERGDTEPPEPVPTSETALLACATFFPVTGSNWSVIVSVALWWVFHSAPIVPEMKLVIAVVQAVCTAAKEPALLECSVETQMSPALPGPVTRWRNTGITR
jgi:hypothetical protein